MKKKTYNRSELLALLLVVASTTLNVQLATNLSNKCKKVPTKPVYEKRQMLKSDQSPFLRGGFSYDCDLIGHAINSNLNRDDQPGSISYRQRLSRMQSIAVSAATTTTGPDQHFIVDNIYY